MRKMNPLTAEDWTIGKIIARIFITPLGLPFIITCATIPIELISYFLGYSDELTMPLVVYPLLPLLYTTPLVLFAKLNIPNWRYSMDGVLHTLTHRQLKKLLQNEEFISTGIQGLYASDLWLKVDGVFVPKNFVLGADRHVLHLPNSRYQPKLNIRLINGRKVPLGLSITLGYDERPARHRLSRLLPHADMNGNIEYWWYDLKNGKRLRQEWKAFKKLDGDVYGLIASWSDFTGYHAKKKNIAN